MRGGRGGFGAYQVAGMVLAEEFPPGRSSRHAAAVQPVRWMGGHRSEGPGGPGGGVFGGVLADPGFADVHQRGGLRDIRTTLGISDLGDLRGPRVSRKRDDGAKALPYVGVDNGRDVASSGQVPLAERVA
jgi:hypothetical protein